MTVKTNEVVIDALEHLVVQSDEAPIEQSEARAAIRALNDMMFAWDADGINLGYTAVSDLADPLTVPLGAIEGIKANLAIRLAPRYLRKDQLVPASLVELAKMGKATARELSVTVSEAAYPSTLPQGSGNTYPSYTDNTFYPDQEDLVLTETGGAIALESDTEEG